ncbi:hypothetical protein O0L34_g9984 [Tuta absoluta]|nr:hypothetical protein O0L34_g9984 [Tuta absoluta]
MVARGRSTRARCASSDTCGRGRPRRCPARDWDLSPLRTPQPPCAATSPRAPPGARSTLGCSGGLPGERDSDVALATALQRSGRSKTLRHCNSNMLDRQWTLVAVEEEAGSFLGTYKGRAKYDLGFKYQRATV